MNEVQIINGVAYMSILVDGIKSSRRCELQRVRPGDDARMDLMQSYRPELFDGEELIESMDGELRIIGGKQ